MSKVYKLSPSDFAYLWEDCKFCYYQKVKNGIYYSGIFPSMFTKINNLLQGSIMGKNIQEVIPGLPSGIVAVEEGFLRSKPVPGTNVYLSGRFDILTKLEDGSYGLIDFKITTPEEDKILKKYTSQLHAYKYALENPQEGKPEKISMMGAISVHPDEMELKNGKIVFSATPRYHEVKENMDDFLKLMKEISDFLDGPEPPEGTECYLCNYRNKLKPTEKIQNSLPF